MHLYEQGNRYVSDSGIIINITTLIHHYRQRDQSICCFTLFILYFVLFAIMRLNDNIVRAHIDPLGLTPSQPYVGHLICIFMGTRQSQK